MLPCSTRAMSRPETKALGEPRGKISIAEPIQAQTGTLGQQLSFEWEKLWLQLSNPKKPPESMMKSMSLFLEIVVMTKQNKKEQENGRPDPAWSKIV